MNTIMIAYNNGVVDTEYHTNSESAIKAARELINKINRSNIIGLRIDFSDGTVAMHNSVQISECLK